MFFLRLILILSLTCTTARAQTTEQIPEATSPMLAGRGILQKGTGSWIALRCISQKPNPEKIEDCDSFRHVYFDAKTQTITEIGPTFNNDETLKKQMKKFGKGFKRYLNQHTSREVIKVAVLFSLTAVFFLGPLFLCTGEAPIIAEGVAGAIQGYVGLPMMFVVTPALGNDPAKSAVRVNKMNRPLQDQSGWNWAEDPKHMRKKMFTHYLNYVRSVKDN